MIFSRSAAESDGDMARKSLWPIHCTRTLFFAMSLTRLRSYKIICACTKLFVSPKGTEGNSSREIRGIAAKTVHKLYSHISFHWHVTCFHEKARLDASA